MQDGERTTTSGSQAAIPFPGNLRDWFAGQVKETLPIELYDKDPETGITLDPTPCEYARKIARWRFMIADAMLAEREKAAKQ